MTGYEIKQGKYVSCRAPGQEWFTRLKTLGVDYTEEALRERISRTRTHTVKAPKPQRSGINLLIYIQNCIKAQESKGYEQWAKIHNLKQAAKALQTAGIKKLPNIIRCKQNMGSSKHRKKLCVWTMGSWKSKSRNMLLSSATLTAFCGRIKNRNIIRKQHGNNFINMETEKFLCYTDCTLPWKGR